MRPPDVDIGDGESDEKIVNGHHDEKIVNGHHDEKTSILSLISSEMVRLYKEQFGRGPTKARTNWSGRDMLIVLLEDTLTPAERNLIALGESQRLRDTRMLFQHARVEQFCEPIERLSGRKVRSFISGIDAAADGMSLEVFVLHPEGYEGPSRIELNGGASPAGPCSSG